MDSNNFTDMKDPAVPLYTADFIIGCTPMTWEERGKYIFLLCYQQQLGHMSLETMTGIVGEIPPIIMRKFIKDDEELYYNERMDEEVSKRARYKEKQAQNSQRRWGNNPNLMPDDMPDLSQTLSQTDTKSIPLDNDNDNDNNNKKKGIGKKPKPFTPPSEVEFVEYFKINGYLESVGKRAYKYYTEMNWHDSTGKPIKSWKGKVVAVWFKDENQAPTKVGIVDLDKLNQERGRYHEK